MRGFFVYNLTASFPRVYKVVIFIDFENKSIKIQNVNAFLKRWE